MAEAGSETSGDRVQRDAPLFSVIVPVFDHWHLVEHLLAALAAQTIGGHRFETILVDNGSASVPDAGVLPADVSLLRCPTPGSYAARNFGARQARGDWLVFTDADCRPDPDWLAAFEREIGSGDGRELIAGAVEMQPSGPAPNACEIYDMLRGIPQQRYVRRGYAATANLAVPKAVFDEIGGFDAARFSGGDAEFCRRAGAHGFPIRFAPDARVGHPARTRWSEVAVKARRVKGGQLTAGSRRRRAAWVVRTLAPPVREVWPLVTAPSQPLRYRLVAAAVHLRVWMVEIGELARLALGGKAERR